MMRRVVVIATGKTKERYSLNDCAVGRSRRRGGSALRGSSRREPPIGVQPSTAILLDLGMTGIAPDVPTEATRMRFHG
ncbi:MAG: hypothetical protein ACM3ZE_21925 [Myxococcales bacterium]